jgi:site-specific DNA recombinase
MQGIKIMEEKCVIYVRVSSDIQDYERQISELKQYANDEKYTIPVDGIFEDKLSGFKDENERHGLKNLMNYCLEHEIKIVLIWEISRLARKHVILLNLVEFFKKNNINIYFKNQKRWLLDDRGNIGGDAGMMIAVMGWYGEYEAKLMQDRFRSKKQLNESLGKYNGGWIPFGYKLDSNNIYIINEDIIEGLDKSEADVVREVFDLYENGFVCSKICRICRSKGYPKIVSSTHTLARLLRNTSYIGFKDAKWGKRPTPAIITEQQFYNVNSLINQNKTKADKGRKHVYLLRGLIKCSYRNNFYVGKQTDDGYCKIR